MSYIAVEKLREKMNGYSQPLLNYGSGLIASEALGMPQTMVIEVSATDVGQTTSSEGTTFIVNMMGKYDLTLTGISTQYSSDPAYMNLGIKSPQLMIPFYPTNATGSYGQYFSVYYPNTHEHNAMRKKCYYGVKSINNQFQIKMIDMDTGLSPANWTSSLLTFEVRKVLNE